MNEPEDKVSSIGKEAIAVPAGGETADKWTVMGIMAFGLFMATLDASIVNISLPKISLSFHVPLSGMVEWVIIAYLIVIASLLLTLGRLVDMVGQKLLWVLGLFIFTASSALCGAAPSLLFLVIFRALQAVGGAMIMAISPAMITRAFSSHGAGPGLGYSRSGGGRRYERRSHCGRYHHRDLNLALDFLHQCAYRYNWHGRGPAPADGADASALGPTAI